MKPVKSSLSFHWYPPAWVLLITLLLGVTEIQTGLQSQEILFQETFETDGDGSRYRVEGGAVYEIDRITSELGLADQQGPIY